MNLGEIVRRVFGIEETFDEQCRREQKERNKLEDQQIREYFAVHSPGLKGRALNQAVYEEKYNDRREPGNSSHPWSNQIPQDRVARWIEQRDKVQEED